jgi:formamidopyrimidine-DNA glycosylase
MALGAADVERLAAAIAHTLALAREDPGRYSRGEGLERLAVYGREGEPCLRCAAPIRRVAQAGRSTYYCPGCQRAPARRTLSRAPRRARP